MIEELLGSLCAEDVLGSFSVTMSSEPPHALCAPDHLGCDVAVDQPPPLLLSAPPPLSSTPVARPQSTALTRGKVQSVGPAPPVLSSTTGSDAGLVEDSAAAVLLQACPDWGKMESVVSEETGGTQAEDSCCYPSGTFYGLSAEVKRLLRDTRGITALYGRPCHQCPLEDVHEMCLLLEENISLFNFVNTFSFKLAPQAGGQLYCEVTVHVERVHGRD